MKKTYLGLICLEVVLSAFIFSTQQTLSFVSVTVFADNAYTHSYRGPASVTRSLLSGLNRLNVPFNCNPSKHEDIADSVIVLSGFNYLNKAIQLKREGKIKVLIAGPNLVGFPEDQNYIAASPEIDWYIAPSLWTKVWFMEVSSKFNILVWPAGVDEEYWKPSSEFKKRAKGYALVYVKEAQQGLVSSVEGILRKYGWPIVKIVYGSYSIGQFKEALNKSNFAIFLGGTESQGIALAESWAMDVPTFVYNLRKLHYRNRDFSVASYCPYLTNATGIDWRELGELEGLVKAFPHMTEMFAPRDWVLENMTDAVCAKNLLDVIDSIK